MALAPSGGNGESQPCCAAMVRSAGSNARALVALEVLGVIDVQHGTGAVLARRPSVASVIKRLREHRHRLPETLEARSTLEVKPAALAASRRTDEDLASIDHALDVMSGEIDDGDRGTHGNELFHQAVTAAAHSGVLAQLTASSRSHAGPHRTRPGCGAAALTAAR
jgi:GntR family transcriptional repressor for pyruvate dehydrogenase complex